MAYTELRPTALADEAAELMDVVRAWLAHTGVDAPERHPLYLAAREHAIRAEEDNGFISYALRLFRRSEVASKRMRRRRRDLAARYGALPPMPKRVPPRTREQLPRRAA